MALIEALTNEQKAQAQLESNDIPCQIVHGSLFISVQDTELELSEDEVERQAKLFHGDD